MRENKIEEYLKDTIHNHGGLCLKFTSPGTTGVPDRVVLYDGNTYFIELKATNGIVRKRQKYVHKQFKHCGIDVHIINSKGEVDAFVKQYIKTERT